MVRVSVAVARGGQASESIVTWGVPLPGDRFIPESRVARSMQNRTGLYGCKERVKSQSASNLSHRRSSLYSSGI